MLTTANFEKIEKYKKKIFQSLEEIDNIEVDTLENIIWDYYSSDLEGSRVYHYCDKLTTYCREQNIPCNISVDKFVEQAVKNFEMAHLTNEKLKNGETHRQLKLVLKKIIQSAFQEQETNEHLVAPKAPVPPKAHSAEQRAATAPKKRRRETSASFVSQVKKIAKVKAPTPLAAAHEAPKASTSPKPASATYSARITTAAPHVDSEDCDLDDDIELSEFKPC